jgi:hypothetical protein
MSVHPDRDVWRVRWREDGRQRSRTFADELGAQRYDRQIRRRLERRAALMSDGQAEIRQWAQRNRIDVYTEWIYVIAAKGLGRLKIGRSREPLKRLRGFQCGLPVRAELVLVMPGTPALERALLDATQQFAVAEAGREWRSLDALEVVEAYIRERAGEDEAAMTDEEAG